MAELNKIYLYRMTHIANVPHILEYGITHRTSANANPNYTPIGDPAIISTRNSFILDNGRLLGEYIPFYFGTKMPMLYVIQKGYNGVPVTPAQEIVYCVTSVQKIVDIQHEFVFTNGHAIPAQTSQFSESDVNRIHKLIDQKAIKAQYWNDENDLDLKRRKEAEFLVSGDLPFASVLGFVVRNEAAKNQLMGFGVTEQQIRIRSNAYF